MVAEDNLTSSLCGLRIGDKTVDSDHITDDTAFSSEEVVCDGRVVRRRKLNTFVEEYRLMPLSRKPMVPWEEASERSKEHSIERTSNIITAVLNTVSEENAACL